LKLKNYATTTHQAMIYCYHQSLVIDNIPTQGSLFAVHFTCQQR